MKNIKHLGYTYQGLLVTSVIEGQDARRAQIHPAFVQINCQGESGADNASGVQIPTAQWAEIQRRGGQ